MALRQIVRTHHPDKAAIWIKPYNFAQRVNGVTCVQILLNRGRLNGTAPRRFLSGA